MKSPFIIFSPFLLLFIIIAILSPNSLQFGDQSRYLIYTQYMIDGFLPDSQDGFNLLGNGPGYSVLLLPFLYFDIPLIFISISNALFYYLSIVILFKILVKFVVFNLALGLTLFWALYFNMYENIVYILPEIFATFLISLFAYLISESFRNKKINKFDVLGGIILGMITLTKPIFAYVTITMIIASVILFFANKYNSNYKKTIFILIICLVSNLPYLIYTYSKTHKLLYWSNVGGNNLYWMSNPNENEYGDWFPDPSTTSFLALEKDSVYFSPKKYIIKNHGHTFEIVKQYSGAKQDEVYKTIAFENIIKNPGKFFINGFSNAGRMLFNFPYSYTFQKPGTLLRLPITGTLLVMLLFSIYPAIKNWNRIPFSVRFLIFFSFIYLGGSLFGSAEIRMFSMVVPILLLWIGIIFIKTIKINIKWE